ncbi:MAG: hypothetical protein HY744_24105 [Deltaproteobacteria bacterium]|nr:hypothetical protein [Deltaproteobacteria bacterium]
MTATPADGGVGPVAALSRSNDHLDIFAVGNDGVVYTAGCKWKAEGPDWGGWWPIPGVKVAPCAPVTAVSLYQDWLDVFVVGRDDGHVYHAFWRPGMKSFDPWHQVGDLVTVLHAVVSAVAWPEDRISLFATDHHGLPMTAVGVPLQPHAGAFSFLWSAWSDLPPLGTPKGAKRTAPRTPICAISPTAQMLHFFLVDGAGNLRWGWWHPTYKLTGWAAIHDMATTPGAPVSAVSRSHSTVDIFVASQDGLVYTTRLKEPGGMKWHFWVPIGAIGFDALPVPPRSVVAAVSPVADEVDVFVSREDGSIATARRQPGGKLFGTWQPLAGAKTLPCAPVAAVSRAKGKADIFALGTDGRVMTSTRRFFYALPVFSSWSPVKEQVFGMADPAVAQWNQVDSNDYGDPAYYDKAFYAENYAWSNEAQGIATDGKVWYLSSNGDKTIRKIAWDKTATILDKRVVWPAVSKNADGHVGALDYYDGWLYVAIQHPWGVWKVWAADFTGKASEWYPLAEPEGSGLLAWCAVNPLNGRLYTNYANGAGGSPKTLLAYDRDTLQRAPDDDVFLAPVVVLGEKGKAIEFTETQGAVFTRNGRAIVVRGYQDDESNAVWCFSSLTGHCFGGRYLGDFGSVEAEVESVAVQKLKVRGVVAHVHVLELDNDPDPDDCYLHSFSVPFPGVL